MVVASDAPPPELRFRRKISLRGSLRELVQARELVWTLAERELRARYKQAMLGFAWALVLPVILMVVFSVFLRRVTTIETGDIPYPLYTYVGLIPWTFFSSAVSIGGLSLVNNVSLINKIYCPREVFPLSSILVAAVDAAVSTTVLVALFFWFGSAPKLTSLWIPVLLTVQIAFTLGVILTLSSVLVYLRDLRHALPILLQFGLFASPVAYQIEIDGSLRWLFAALNPLAPVIDGYRLTVLSGDAPDLALLGVGALGAMILLAVGYLLFKKLETGFADVA